MENRYDNLFVAFEEYKNKLATDPEYNRLLTELRTADTSSDTCTGKISRKVIDLDWVVAIENSLVDIDGAIREQRRFIENIEEVVGIEKARRITSESVRHLAQHTNLISRVEDDEVTPEKILNIHREESFTVYENRFLWTLCNDLVRFINERCDALSEVSDDAAFRFEMPRDFRINGENVGIDFSYDFSHSEQVADLDLQADVSTLTDFQRVLRIKKIATDFLSLPLMKQLKGCEPIRPPIVRTNVMKRNIHFINSVEIYTFIQQYSRLGYTIVSESDGGVIDNTMKSDLLNAYALSHFIVKLNIDPSLRKQLSDNYIDRIENNKRALEEEESLRNSKWNYLLEAARKEEANKYLDEIDRLNGLLRVMQEKLNYYKMNYIRQTRTVNKLMLSLKRLAKKMEAEIAYQKELKQREIDALKKDWETFVFNQKDMRNEQVKQVQDACRRQLAAQNKKHLDEISKLQTIHEQEIAALKEKYEKIAKTDKGE